MIPPRNDGDAFDLPENQTSTISAETATAPETRNPVSLEIPGFSAGSPRSTTANLPPSLLDDLLSSPLHESPLSAPTLGRPQAHSSAFDDVDFGDAPAQVAATSFGGSADSATGGGSSAPRAHAQIEPLTFAGASFATSSSGGGGSGTPLVTIEYETPTTTEGSEEPATFVVSRSGDDNIGALMVYYDVSGSATPGVDYTALVGSVTIPDGSGSATIEVHSLEDVETEGMEEVIVTITEDASYQIDSGEATVAIFDPVALFIDIDVDSNNDGAIDPEDDPSMGTDDPIEEDAPGMLLGVNDDDDNENAIHDWQEAPLLDENGALMNDDDLVVAYLEIEEEPESPGGGGPVDLAGYQVQFEVTGGVKIWETQAKENELTAATITLNSAADLPAEVYLEGYTAGAATITVTLIDDAGQEVDDDAVVVQVNSVDLDIDSDNSGALDGTQAEDAIEMRDPGKLIRRNQDDDNNDGTTDFDDDGPFVDENGDPMNDNELVPIELDFTAGPAAAGMQYELELSYVDSRLKVWTTQDKQQHVPDDSPWVIGTDTPPTTLYVEGLTYGRTVMRLELNYMDINTGAEAHSIVDRVVVSVFHVGLIAYRPQTEGPGYGGPFARTKVPWQTEEITEENQTAGVGIRRNGDDDDGDGTEDFDPADTGINGENDLIEVEMVMPTLSGVEYVLKRTNDNINVWDGSDKTDSLLDPNGNDHDSVIHLTDPQATTASNWVEWVEMDDGETSANLTLTIRDKVNGVDVYSDTLSFYPFKSIVIALGGEFEYPGDPPQPGFGTFHVAVSLYQQGYDVHMYDEDEVEGLYVNDDIQQPEQPQNIGRGPVYDEIVEAVTRRGVTQVAIFGYSHGGGSTFDLTKRLDENRSAILDQIQGGTGTFTLPFTSYVDANENDHEFDSDPERRRPRLTQYHMNQYQTGAFGGAPITANGESADFELNVENRPWGAGVNHLQIDGLIQVRNNIENGLKAHVSR